MKIIYNRIIPGKGFAAINLFGVVFARKECNPLSKRSINHERIHTAQMKEMCYVFFYLWYGIECVVLLLKYRNREKAYYNIRFEKEAYKYETDKEYLKRRKLYSWIKN